MYAKYAYLNTATMDQILDDIVLILTGTTNPASLSASCDTTNTEILTTLSTSPWAVWDDVSATQQILRVEMDDDAGVYKYVGINHDTDQIALSIAFDWNNVAHTGTNEIVADYTYHAQGFQIASGGYLHIYASQYAIVFMHESAAGLLGNSIGNLSYGSVGVWECSRGNPSLAVGDMPNWFIGATSMFSDVDTGYKAKFVKGRDYTNTVQTPFTAEMVTQCRDITYNGSNKYPAGLGGCTALTGIGAPTRFALQPIQVSGGISQTLHQSTTFYGDVSDRCDIWYLPEGTNDVLDHILVNDVAYKIFKGGTQNIATVGTVVGVKFVVPYG